LAPNARDASNNSYPLMMMLAEKDEKAPAPVVTIPAN
jgi:hypothetical protein